MIVDFHTHTFPEKVSLRIIEGLSETGHVNYFTNASMTGLSESMEKNGIDYSVNLPVMTREDQVSKINDNMIRDREALLEKHIITFGGLHPDFPDIKGELHRLHENGIPGIKLHSAFHHRNINEKCYKDIFAAASEEDMIVTIHAGTDISFLDENCASVEQILDVVDDVRPTKLVLAHMGGWQDWDTVEKYLAGAPVWLDTSYSMGPMSIKAGHDDKMPFKENMTPERLARLARKHGVDKVLFGTDSPWSDQGLYVEYLQQAGFEESERKLIEGENALKLLGMAK